MAKKLLGKNGKYYINTLLMIAGTVALIGIGGLFINGTFLSVVLLKLLPLLIHQLVGWVIIVSAILGLIGYFVK